MPRQIDAPTELRADGRRKGPQHEKGVASQVAAETGLSVRTVQRALNPPPLVREYPPVQHEPIEDDRGRRRLIAGKKTSAPGFREFVSLSSLFPAEIMEFFGLDPRCNRVLELGKASQIVGFVPDLYLRHPNLAKPVP